MARFEFDELVRSLVATRGWHRSSTGSAYGTISGQPVNVASTVDANNHKFVSVIVATASRATGEATRNRWAESIDGLRKGSIKVHDTAVEARFTHNSVGRNGNEKFGGLVDQMVAIAVAEGKVLPANAGSRPGLVNGLPCYLTDAEASELAAAGRMASSEYENRKARIADGLGLGLAGMVISAIAWAVIAVVLDREFWMVAIGAGALISFMVLRGAGKTTVGIQAIIGVLTVAAVILGQILSVAWLANRELGTVNARIVLDLYKDIISVDPGSLVFALGAGLVGAWYGVKYARQPNIEPQIDMVPA